MEESQDITVDVAPPRSGTGRLRRAVWWLFKRSIQLVLLLFIGLLAALVGWLQSEDFQRRVTSIVEHVLEDRLGEEASITRVNVRFWPPGVDGIGLHVFHGATGETILSAERIRVPVVLRAGRPGIGQLHVQRPDVHLHLDKSGKLREFRNAYRPPPEDRVPLRRLPWSSIRVVDGSFRLDHPEGHIVVEHLDLDPTRGPVTDLRADLELRVRALEDATHIEWNDVVLGPDVIVVPDLDLRLDALTLTGRAAYTLNGPLDTDLVAHVELEQLNPLLTEPRAVHGTVDMDIRAEGTIEDPTLHVTALASRLGLDVPGVFTDLLTYDIGEATASVIARKDGIQLEQVVIYQGEGQLVAWGFITPDKRLVNGHVVGHDVRLAPLLQAFDAAPTPWVDMAADAEISWEGPLDPLHLEGTFDLSVADLHVGNRPIADPRVDLMLDIPHAHAKGTIEIEKHHVYLSAPMVQGPVTQGSATIDIGFGPRGPLDLQADLWAAHLEDFQPLADVELVGDGRITGRIFGPFNALQLEAEGDVRDFSVMGIPYADRLVARLLSPDMKSLYLEDAVARLGSSRYHGRYGIDFKPPIAMETDIVIDEGRVEDMVNMFVELEGLKGALTGTLWLDGPLFDMDGEAHMVLSDVELYGEHFEEGEGHGYMDKGRFTLDDLRVRRQGGKAGITLRGSVEREWKLDMELIADGIRLEDMDRLAPYEMPLSGRLAVLSRITNTLFDPSPNGRIWVTDVRYSGESIEDSIVDVQTIDGIANYSGAVFGGAAHVDGTLGLWNTQPYALTAQLEALPAHLLYPLGADGTPIRAEVSGQVDISGHFGEDWSPVTLVATLPEVEVAWSRHVLRNEGPWYYRQDGNSFELQGFNVSGAGTDLTLDATKGGDVLVLVGQGHADLDLLRAVVPGLDRATGQATVQLRAVGTQPYIKPEIEIVLDAELLRHDSTPLTFEDTHAQVQVRPDRIDVLSVDGELGGGMFSGRGFIEAKDWIPTRYDLAMDVRDAEVQWVDSLPPAIGDGNLRFDGPVGALLLSGDLQISDMTFADRIDWEDWVVEYREQMLVDPATVYDEEPMFNMNVQMRSDGTIRLRNNVAEGTASADLRVIGDTARPGLVGTVQVHDGSLAFLQDREFRIDRGTLLFNDPWTWDPQLDFSLLTDVVSREQRYRVDYQVFGPFSDWRSTSRSDPPLAQSDVNSLLWFGVTLDELEEMGELSTAVGQAVADLIVTDLFVSGQADLGEDIPVLFDRIDLATGVNARGDYSPEPRLVVEKRVDELEIDLKWELNLVRPDDVYVSADRRIGGIWSLSGWYATLQRDRVLPIGGAYGVDVTARWEIE